MRRQHWSLLETAGATQEWKVSPPGGVLSIAGLSQGYRKASHSEGHGLGFVPNTNVDGKPGHSQEPQEPLHATKDGDGEQLVPIDDDRFKVTLKARGSLRPCHRAFGMVTDKACQTEPHILNNLREGKLEKFKSLRPTNFQAIQKHGVIQMGLMRTMMTVSGAPTLTLCVAAWCLAVGSLPHPR